MVVLELRGAAGQKPSYSMFLLIFHVEVEKLTVFRVDDFAVL